MKVSESGKNGQSLMSTTVIKLTFIIFIVSKKIATLKFLPHMDNQPANWLAG